MATKNHFLVAIVLVEDERIIFLLPVNLFRTAGRWGRSLR